MKEQNYPIFIGAQLVVGNLVSEILLLSDLS